MESNVRTYFDLTVGSDVDNKVLLGAVGCHIFKYMLRVQKLICTLKTWKSINDCFCVVVLYLSSVLLYASPVKNSAVYYFQNRELIVKYKSSLLSEPRSQYMSESQSVPFPGYIQQITGYRRDLHILTVD